MKIRVGFGYDMHRLQKGREFWLGGVRLDHDLGLGRIGLQLGLAVACFALGGIDAGNHLAFAHAVTLAQRKVLQCTGHTALDQGAVHRRQAAADGHLQRQGAHLQRGPVGCAGLQHGGGRLLLRLQGLLLLAFGHHGPPGAEAQGQNDQGDQAPKQPGSAEQAHMSVVWRGSVGCSWGRGRVSASTGSRSRPRRQLRNCDSR